MFKRSESSSFFVSKVNSQKSKVKSQKILHLDIFELFDQFFIFRTFQKSHP